MVPNGTCGKLKLYLKQANTAAKPGKKVAKGRWRLEKLALVGIPTSSALKQRSPLFQMAERTQ
jgi:hypothetical protein